jgi:hypothetical protein
MKKCFPKRPLGNYSIDQKEDLNPESSPGFFMVVEHCLGPLQNISKEKEFDHFDLMIAYD